MTNNNGYQDDLHVEYTGIGSLTPTAPQAAPPAPQKPKRKNGAVRGAALVLACGLLGGAAGFGGSWIYESVFPPSPETPASASVGATVSPDAPVDIPSPSAFVPTVSADGTMTYEELYEKCAGSVVAIECTVQTRSPFGTQSAQGSGSGFFVASNGYILTNYHVVEGASRIEVVLTDGTRKEAALINYQSDRDVAIIKVEGTGYVPLTLGDSDDLEVGTPIVAIGNPLGTLAGTMTQGIISGVNRDIQIENISEIMLQIDAAVSPGNSGGPLLNMRGEVVGIVSAKSTDRNAEGIGFAIPSNAVRDIQEELMASITGGVTLGVSVREVTGELAQEYGLPEGLYVASISPGGNAARAGLQIGDVITGFNGADIRSLEDLKAELDGCDGGDTASITVSRAGVSDWTSATLTVVLTSAQPMAA